MPQSALTSGTRAVWRMSNPSPTRWYAAWGSCWAMTTTGRASSEAEDGALPVVDSDEGFWSKTKRCPSGTEGGTSTTRGFSTMSKP